MRPVSDDFMVHRGRVAMDNALHGLRALIVDDNERSRRALVEMLTHQGLKPTAVESATSALTALRTALDEQCPYSLALLDSMMPDMDGMSLARRIRSDDRLDGLALIMLSSPGQVDDAASLRSLNISHCLTEPIQQSDLLSAIMRAVPGRSEPGEETDRHAGMTDDSLDREAVFTLAGRDEQLVSEIIQMFLEEAPQQLGEIDRALADGDAERLQRAAHKFKGSAMLFSARSTVEAARELEERCRSSDLIGAQEVQRRLHEETARLRESLLRWNRELGDTA
jgi:CheY-like chemotaxis protein/HPt (histidine-containing phosphotransfer) domain-containing protein